nr:hypothetical protein CFP56_39955 [Quercus suber]
MWDAINIANNHDLISLDLILVDKEGTLIHASIRKNPAQISKFSGFDHSIPQSQFEFADYRTIASRCYDTTYLTDVIGILDYIGAIEEIKTRGRPTKMRNIQLLLEENKSVQTTFFRGDYQLSSTFATKLYVNLDIPEVAEIRNKYTTMDINVKEILPKGLLKVQDGELALQNKKTVAEIKDLEWNPETKDLLVTCNAKIININNKYGCLQSQAIEYKSKYKMRPVQPHSYCLTKELRKLYLKLQKNLQRCKKR